MGTWGPGLYSDDFALDLKAAISVVCRLAHDASELVCVLLELNPSANQPGEESADLHKRAKALDNLGERLAQKPEAKNRRTIKKPQPLLIHPGDVYIYPVDSQANCYNPYFKTPD